MRIRIAVIAAATVSSLLWGSSAMAQQHVIDPAAMRQAVVTQTVTDQHNREAVLGVLQQSQVRDVAARLGLSVTRAESAVSTLDSAELASMAASAREANGQLAGGSGITISVTMLLVIIIAILVLR
jgi:FlaG/FlaF family flagellin (archaellin)